VNDIYPTNKIISKILQEKPSGYFNIIRKEFPEFYHYLTNISDKKFSETLYLHLYPGPQDICKHCRNNKTRFMEITTGYTPYCSKWCSDHSSERKTAAKNNANKAKATYKSKTGFDHPMHNPKIRDPIIAATSAREKQKYYIEFTGNLTKTQYVRKARHVTNNVYKSYKNIIDPLNLRSREYVIDHIYSIFDGYKNNVPFEIICHPSNMRIISRTDNSIKHNTSEKTIKALYENAEAFSIKYLITGIQP
jgi:hypothetical protein